MFIILDIAPNIILDFIVSDIVLQSFAFIVSTNTLLHRSNQFLTLHKNLLLDKYK